MTDPGLESHTDSHGDGLSDEARRWVLDCYSPTIGVIADTFLEAVFDFTRLPDEVRPVAARPGSNLHQWADHAARAVLARLANHDPPITVDFLNPEDQR